MKSLTSLIFHVAVVSASCGDGAWRCKGGPTVDDDYIKTDHCRNEIAKPWCYCNYMADWYALPQDLTEDFKECCDSFQGYHAEGC